MPIHESRGDEDGVHDPMKWLMLVKETNMSSFTESFNF